MIPRIFHFTFGLRRQTEPFHLLHYLCLESCLRVNKPERLLFHYHFEPWGEYWDLIKDRVECVRVPRPSFPRWFAYADRSVEKYRYAHESDFLRLDALIEHGGVYADIDTLFVHPIPDELFGKPFVLGREDDVQDQTTGQLRPSLCNAFIMSEPNAEFCRLWRQGMEEVFDGSWSNHSTLLPWKISQERPELIHVEPSHTFYPFMWTSKDLDRLLEGCEAVDKAVASIHVWAHLWWNELRKDFSNFHGGLMTEDHVRSVDTTFNVLARPFLPAPGRHVSVLRRLDHACSKMSGRGGEMLSRVVRRIRRDISQRVGGGSAR